MTGSEGSRVVIVTGASRGLGKEIALAFGKAGDKVVINYLRSETEASAVAEAINRSGGVAVPFRADARMAGEVDNMMHEATARWGRIDVLVNNAGLTRDGIVIRMSEKDWDEVIGTNLTGSFNCIRAASQIMSGQRSGHIISIASIVGMQGREGQANYAASKAGLVGLTRACARELGCFNIKVNVVLPGYLPTDMGREISQEVLDRVLKQNVLGRISDQQEVASFVYNLSHMEHVSGQLFNLDSRIL